MARSYRVSVNGKSYDVVVEEMGASSAPAAFVPAPAPVAAAPAPAPVAAAPAPVAAAPAAAPAAPAAPIPAGAGTVEAPMPGKIWKVPVKQGDVVAKDQLVLILEAMKMENEIFSPVAGTVLQVNCREGDSVNTGDTLLVIG